MDAAKIYDAMACILFDVEGIKKEKKNQQQGFMFRGIDDMYNCLHDLFAKHKVFISSEVLDTKREERTTKSGGNLIYTVLTIKFSFYTTDGSFVSSTLIGEAMDSADKSCNKAMSVALKYALMQTFLIPTEELKDPDAETPPPSSPKAPSTQNQTKQPVKKVGASDVAMGKLIERIKTGNESKGDLIAHAKEVFILTPEQLKQLENL